MVEAITGRIRDAFGRVKRAVPPGYLEAQTERALLEQRRYQKRMFHGEPHLRALLHGPGDKGPSLVYLPEAVADKLPLYQRFGADHRRGALLRRSVRDAPRTRSRPSRSPATCRCRRAGDRMR